MRLQIVGLVLLFFSVFNLSLAYSQQFDCMNTANWETLATNSNPYDYHTNEIKPDGSPDHTLDFAEQLDALYTGDEYVLDVNTDSECYAANICESAFSGNWNQPGCVCSHFPQTGCNRVTWQRRGHPNLISGGVGTQFPPYPQPTYPTPWNERYIYSHSYSAGTSDNSILLNINANVDQSYTQSSTLVSSSKCSEDTTTINGVEVFKKYFILNGLANNDQSFNATQPRQDWTEDWGVCGTVHQYWLESDATTVSWPRVEKTVPVIAYVPTDSSFEYEDRNLGCNDPYVYRGSHFPSDQACVHSYTSDDPCPDGYTRYPAGFGYGRGCRNTVAAEYNDCSSGWEINPINSGQCRRAQDFTPPPTDNPPAEETFTPVSGGGNPDGSDIGATDGGSSVSDSGDSNSGSGDDGSSGSDSGSSGSDGSGSGDSNSQTDTTPPWCTGAGYVWDASTSTCTSPDGGEVVTPGPNPDSPESNNPTLVAFGDAPIAGDTTGTRDIFANGFYTPVYSPDTTISSFVETAIAGWNTETLRTRLMTFVPPSGAGALPNTCMTLSMMTDPVCIDLNSYAFVFNALRGFLYLLAGFSAYRIIIGA